MYPFILFYRCKYLAAFSPHSPSYRNRTYARVSLFEKKTEMMAHNWNSIMQNTFCYVGSICEKLRKNVVSFPGLFILP